MSNTQVQFNVNTIVNNVWYPSELKTLGSVSDDLAQQQKTLYLDKSVQHSIRSSIIDAPFETLHALWSPVAPPPAFDSASVKVEFKINYVEKDGKTDGYFAVSSKFPNRTYLVQRSEAHLRTLIESIRTSFPQFLVPDMSTGTNCTALFTSLLQHHLVDFFSFLPMLFFLFEKEEKAVSGFFTALENTLKSVKNSEATVVNAFKVKESRGWFSFGSSKQKVQTFTVAENIEFIEKNISALPTSFKNLFFRYTVLKSSFAEISQSIDSLLSQFFSEGPILRRCGVPLQDLKRADPSGTVETFIQCMQTDIQCQSEEEKRFRIQVANSTGSVNGVISAIEKYIVDYLNLVRIVVENLPFINGTKKLQKDFPAYEHKSLFIKGGELFKAYAQAEKAWSALLDDEVKLGEDVLRKEKRNLCRCVFEMMAERLSSDCYSAV